MSTAPYIVLRGGIVENKSPDDIAVIDMDVLDSDFVGPDVIEDARNLRDQIQILAENETEPSDKAYLESLVAEANSWLHRNDNVEPYTGRPVFEN